MACALSPPHTRFPTSEVLFNANQSEETLHIPMDAQRGIQLSRKVGTKQACGDRAAIHIPAVTSRPCCLLWRPGGCWFMGLEGRRGGDGSSWCPVSQHISSRLTPCVWSPWEEVAAPQWLAQAEPHDAAGDVEQGRGQQLPWNKSSSPAAPADSRGCAVPLSSCTYPRAPRPSVPRDTGLGEHPEHHSAQVQSLGLRKQRRE